MSTKIFSFATSKNVFLYVILFTISVAFLSSCGNSEVKPLVNNDNCFTMSRAALKTNMLAGSWSSPGSRDYIPYIYFNPEKSGTDISIDAYPADGNNVIYNDRKVSVSIAKTEPPCTFPDTLKIVQNRYDFSNEKFADKDGKLISFDFLRFVPRACTDPGYTDVMVFDVFAVSNEGGIETAVAKGTTKPCPPYCPTTSGTDKK